MTNITLVACVNQLGGMSNKGEALFQIPSDLKRFKEITDKQIVVMSRKMYEYIVKKNGSPLLNRLNVVITTDKNYKEQVDSDVIVYNSVEPILKQCINEVGRDDREVFVIGGEQIFKQFINYADRVELTVVDDTSTAFDKAFPMEQLNNFQVVNRIKSRPDETPPYEVVIYKRT